ncbi:transposase [Candidatus Daviesbacteria bacterium]|nr:transposase [Candidatus Daviesbacteria bacterium]
MALRKTILATDQIYHIYNRGVEKRPIFLNRRGYNRFLQVINYYRFANCPVKFSQFKALSQDSRNDLLNKLEIQSDKHVEILAFCLMPNHIHFLCKQLKEKGISKFMGKLSSGYSHYFNTINQRVGPLFQGNFKAVRIETDEQLVHTSRYIHLNPVSSYLIEFDSLESYEYSSYPEYTGRKTGFCNTEQVLSYFKSIKAYKDFVGDQVDYARELENIKHLILED